MKTKKKKVVLILIALVVFMLFIAVFLNLPKPVKSSNMAFDLSNIEDGAYLGDCDNGLVKVQTEVLIHNHAIANVNILKHDNGMGKAAENIISEVIQQQSVEIDAVSGATMSSKTILKAIETALSKGANNK